MTLPQLKLYIWKGDYGLPSFCPECTFVMTYVKITNAPVVCEWESNPYRHGTATLPIIRQGELYIFTVNLMLGYLRSRRYEDETELSRRLSSHLHAFVQFVEYMLKPVIEYIYWVDEKNYNEVTRPWFTKIMMFPSNLLFTRVRRFKARHLLELRFGDLDSTEFLEVQVLVIADDCFTSLKGRLGGSDYFYGSSPTVLDALMYAYLSPILKVPFPNDRVTLLLKNYTELVDYVERMDRDYFPTLQYREKQSNKSAEHKTTPLLGTVKVATFTCVVCAVIMYCYKNDVVNLSKIHSVLDFLHHR